MSKKPVIRFEMAYNDRERMSKFYESVFGWETVYLGEEMGKYVCVTTMETAKRVPRKPRAINGGFYPNADEWAMQYPAVVIEVEDVQTMMRQVIAAGGRLSGLPMLIPGIGLYLAIFDTEGNRVVLLQPAPEYKGVPRSQ